MGSRMYLQNLPTEHASHCLMHMGTSHLAEFIGQISVQIRTFDTIAYHFIPFHISVEQNLCALAVAFILCTHTHKKRTIRALFKSRGVQKKTKKDALNFNRRYFRRRLRRRLLGVPNSVFDHNFYLSQISHCHYSSICDSFRHQAITDKQFSSNPEVELLRSHFWEI